MAAGLATSELQTWLKSRPWYSAQLVLWCFGLAVVLSGVVLILQRRLGESSGRAPATRTEADFQRNRRQLLERVRADWIEGVLEQSLYKVARIELGLETKPDAVESPLDVAVQRPGQEPQPLPLGTPIRSVFDDLLMLAKYGVGAQRAAPAPARHALYPKTTLYSASINRRSASDPG